MRYYATLDNPQTTGPTMTPTRGLKLRDGAGSSPSDAAVEVELAGRGEATPAVTAQVSRRKRKTRREFMVKRRTKKRGLGCGC